MGSKLLLVVLLVLFSLYVTSGYALSTRDVVSKQEDETYVMATTGQGFSMIDVEDIAKPRSLRALVDGSKVVVNKKGSSKSTPSKKDKKKKKKNKKKKKKGEVGGIIAGAIILTIIIICVLYYLHYKRKTEKAQRIEQEKKSRKLMFPSEPKTSQGEQHV